MNNYTVLALAFAGASLPLKFVPLRHDHWLKKANDMDAGEIYFHVMAFKDTVQSVLHTTAIVNRKKPPDPKPSMAKSLLVPGAFGNGVGT